MEISSILNDKYQKAKIKLYKRTDLVFITTVLGSLKKRWSHEVPTMGTDGLCLVMNPDWVETLPVDEISGVLLHEAWHTAYMHMARRGNKDARLWNYACDYVINLHLIDDGFSLPPGGLHEEKYRGLCANEVYDLLMQDPPPEEPEDSYFGSDMMDPGEGEEGGGAGAPMTASEEKTLKSKLEEIVLRAHTQSEMSKSRGNIPTEIQRDIDALLNPKLDWRTILQNYMTAFAKDDFSWRKPNKRFFPDHYLPSAYSEATGEIAFAVDESCSVTPMEFRAFISEMNDIKQKLDPELMSVIGFDTSIRSEFKLTRDQDISEVAFHGGGGTYLQPVFDYYKDKKPVVLVVFSDLYCDVIQEDPGYPVVWIVVNNEGAEVKFGTKIDYDTTDLPRGY